MKNLNKHPFARLYKTILAILLVTVFANTKGIAQTIYVNDNSTTSDVFTTAIGNDVSGNGSTSAPYATITKAITVATAGTTIRVDAGTYTANLTINKNLTFIGANNGTLGNGTRVPESIIKDSKLTISGTGAIVIDGFHIYQTTTLVGATIDIGASTPTIVRNCKIERVGATAGVIAVGIQTASSATAAISITRNFITGSSAGGLFSSHKTWNSGIFSNGGSNISITYNQFTNCRTAINSDNQSTGVAIDNNNFGVNGTQISYGGSGSTSSINTHTGNTFTVTSGFTTFNCSNVSTAFRVDVTNSTFGTTAAASMSLTDCYTLESTIIHKGASSKNGLITYVTGKLFKTSTTTMANNITYATAGNTIHVASGTISEAITVNKSLTIYGNNYAVNPNDGSWAYNSSRATESIISANSVTIAASNVEFTGFKITGCTNNMAIGNTNPSTTYSNITIKNNWITANTNVRGIWFTASSGQAYDGIQIVNNRLEANTSSSASAQISGIDLWRSGGHTISGNYVSAANYNGIKSDGYGTNAITGNRIVGCKIAGISVQPTYANGQVVTVSNNIISGCQEGVAVWSSTSTYPNIKFQILNNTITIDAGKLDINYPAINVQNISSGDNAYTNLISGNTITYSGTIGSSPFGFFPSSATAAYGVSILGSVGKLTVQNNVLDGGNVNAVNLTDANMDMAGVFINTSFPILDGSNPVTTAVSGTILVQNNDIKNFKNGVTTYDYTNSSLGNIPVGTSFSVNNNSIVPRSSGKAFLTGSGGAGIAGTCNWYGSASYSAISGLFTGNVTYISFLINGSDNDGATTGFQPVAGACIGVDLAVPTVGATSGVFTTITPTSLALTFTKGNGSKRVIFVKANSAIGTNPTDNSVYSGNANFGSGTALDNGYAVYNDTGSVVTVTNLTASTNYYFSVYEYNFSGANYKYASSLVYTNSATTLQPDADGDGVADADDEYPSDQYKAFNNNYPATGYGTLMFEDLWPATGDYDFNDLVLNYRFNTITNAANQVVEVRYSIVTRAIGGALHNGFAFQLDGVNPNKIVSVTGSKATGASWISLNSNGTEADQGVNANILVFDDAYKLLATHGGYSFVNVSPGCPDSGTDTTTVVVKFQDGATLPSGGALNYTSFAASLFNPYIIIAQTRGKEVHLIDRVPSAKMNATFFGQDQDRSNPTNGSYFKTSQNLPWAIDINTSVPYTQEKIDISAAYLKFIEWASSSGALQNTWYLNNEGNRDNTKLFIR